MTLLEGTRAVYCCIELVTLNRYVLSGDTGLKQYEEQLSGAEE